jgi:PAS domain S-box-containing protein
MGMHMYQLEPDGRLAFIGANPAADEILGVDNSQFVGKSIEEAFPALSETEVPEQYRLVAATGKTWRIDQILYEENEIAGAFEVYAFQTSAERMVAAFLDITERKRAEDEVLRLQHLLQNITDSMPSALVTLDLEGRVLTWNPAAETLTGRAAEQVQGQSLWESCPELARYQDLFEGVLREGQVAQRLKEPLTTEAGAAYRDVSVFPLEADEPASTGSPQVEGAVLRIDDVTRRVQLEDMMLQSAKMASVGGLAAGVAHEINNPLGAMMQSAQMLQLAFNTQRPRTRTRLERHGVDPEGLGRYLDERGLREYMDGIRATGERAAKIVSDLLSFSRRTSSDMAPRDLNALVEQTLDLAAADYDLRKKYDFRDIQVVRDFAPDLPPLVCDGQQVQQVVLNLVRNAAQAMAEKMERREGEYQPRLTLRTSRRRGWIRLEVEDNGPGVSEGMRERLFEPFFTTKGVGEGTGLGLWLCWSIVVERHGGRIRIEPVPPVPPVPRAAEGGAAEGEGSEGGSRFVVELPPR